jgi:hypothetical protein
MYSPPSTPRPLSKSPDSLVVLLDILGVLGDLGGEMFLRLL